MVIVTGQILPGATDAGAWISFSIDGTTTPAATLDQRAVFRSHGSSGGTGAIQASTTTVVTGLTAATHTFALTYRTGGGDAGTFLNRTITVIPLG
jgi:hypothetical protein